MYLSALSLVLLLTTSSHALVNARGGSPKCTADACGAAVSCTASSRAIQSAHRADCSAYQRQTVTPDATTRTVTTTKRPTPLTTTVTVTPTVTVTELTTTTAAQSTSTHVIQSDIGSGAKVKRGGAEPAVPTYASACSNGDAYASACACWGISACTVTAPRSTATSTVTVYSPTQKTVTATAPTSTVTETQVSTVQQPPVVVNETVACSPSGPSNIQAQDANSPPGRYAVYCHNEQIINPSASIGVTFTSGFQNCVDFCGQFGCASLNYFVNGNGAGVYCIIYARQTGQASPNPDAIYALRT